MWQEKALLTSEAPTPFLIIPARSHRNDNAMPPLLTEPETVPSEQAVPPPACTDREAFGLYAAVTLLVLLAGLLHRALLGPPVFPVDDAYITLHNAQVLHWGHDPNYPGTPALAGATSPVHLALVALLMFALPPATALWAALWLATLAYALGLVQLARVHGATPTQALLLVLVGLAAGQTPHQLMNGLETGLMLAAVTWALALASEPERAPPEDAARATHPNVWLPCLCGLLPYIRPDLLPLALGLLALQAGRHRRAAGSWRVATRPILTDLGLALACTAPWALWCLLSTGEPYPSSLAAKRLYFAQDGWPPSVKASLVGQGFTLFAGDLGLVCLGGLLLWRTGVGRIGLLLAAALGVAYYAQFPGALATYEGRYLYPLLPFLLYGAASAWRWGKAGMRGAVTGLLVLALLQSCWRAPDFWARHQVFCDYTRVHLAGVAAWCNANLPPGATLLVHDAGYIAYATRFHLVDLVGLKTPSSVAAHRALTHPSGGALRGAAVSRIAREGHADYLLVLWTWERDSRLAGGLRDAGWDVRLINDQYAFRVYALRPPKPPAL